MFMLRLFRNLFYLIVVLVLFGILIAFIYGRYLDDKYQLADQGLNGALWSLPAHVYARPLELYTGAPVTLARLARELELLGYQKVSNDPIHSGTYTVDKNRITYYANAFPFWDGRRPARKIEVDFAQNQVLKVLNRTTLEPVIVEKLNPLQIAMIYPSSQEDRLLVSLDKDVPPLLVKGLVALEDRTFWTNHGVDPRGLLRSIYVTFIARTGYQGASTLTQQFIKNHYLSDEQTYSRKIKEMLMAIALETHVSKKQILEGYLNEIYLGQDGKRAIHGFGRASEFFFNKPLKALNIPEIALLLGLVREPAPANPYRHPQYALKRRNFVLSVLESRGVITQAEMTTAQAAPLGVVPPQKSSERIRYPAFVDMVMKQLWQRYKREDLTRGGLNIFTTLDPVVQEEAQGVMASELARLEHLKHLRRGFLQGAAVVVNSDNGDVSALIGGRVPEPYGFNRALQANRQIGSVVKPLVYLSALEWPGLYTLATLLDDSDLNYKIPGGGTWSPHNYDHRSHGSVLLINALAHSYNAATARLALRLGLDEILNTLRRLGAHEPLPRYPSVALGAVQMTPVEVAQIYETFANGGYYTPLRTILNITTSKGQLIDRYGLKNIQKIYPGPHYLITRALQEVVKTGTARGVNAAFPKLNIAGKTGTTDSYRDSWFAGFSGNTLSVVWVGNDENLSTHLSGASGAMKLWIQLMKLLPQRPLDLKEPQGIVDVAINRATGLRAASDCTPAEIITLPFLAGSAPSQSSSCAPPPEPENDDGAFPDALESATDNF